MPTRSQTALVKDILRAAETHVETSGGDADKILAMIGTVPPDVTMLRLQFTATTLAFDLKDTKERGKKIFEKFKKYLKEAVCDDFKYCSKKREVNAALKDFLPDIIKYIIKRIPLSGKLPKWLVTLLRLIGITASSLEVLIALFVAWLIIKGCDELCQCK